MNLLRSLSLAVAGVFVLGTASANEVILTAGQAKGGNRMALDFASSGNATGFQFEVAIPGAKKVDTSKCLAELPKTHTGACQFKADTGTVIVMVYSNENAVLPDGVNSIGWLSAPGAGKGATVKGLLVADTSGNPLPVSNSAQQSK